MTTTRTGTDGGTTSRPRTFFGEFYASDVGKKWVMAVTGIVLLTYLFVHMLGNLKIYLGAEHLNTYAEWLRTILEPFMPRTAFLWLFRIVMLTAFVLHIHAAYVLTVHNWKARGWGSRPVRYHTPREYLAADYASRTMRWSGVIIFLFVVWHLLDLTIGSVNPDFIAGDVYHNVVASFSVLWISLFYIVANLLLGMHLYHGAWSLFQSLGWNNPRFNPWRRWFATAFAVIVVAGNVSFPIAVLTGIVG